MYRVDHIYGDSDGAPSTFNFNDWLVPRNVSGLSSGGAPSKSSLWKGFSPANTDTAMIKSNTGVIGYGLGVESSANALMSKWP